MFRNVIFEYENIRGGGHSPNMLKNEDEIAVMLSQSSRKMTLFSPKNELFLFEVL